MRLKWLEIIHIVIFIILTVSLCGCKKESDSTIQQKSFSSKNYNLINETYNWDNSSQRTFEMKYDSYNDFGIGFEIGLFTDDENQLHILLEDLKKFISVLGPMKKFDLYIVSSSPKRVSYADQNKVFLLKDDFLLKNYKTLLLVAYELNYEWSGYGLNAYVLEEKAEESMLTEYYLTHDSLDCLELLPTRFIEDWNTQEELTVVKNSAISLTRYVIENYDIKTLNQVDHDIRTKWLKYINVDKDYQYSYGDIGSYSYSSDASNLLVVDSGRNMYYLNKISGFTDCSDDVENVLFNTENETKYICDFLSKNFPTFDFDLNLKRNIIIMSGSYSISNGVLNAIATQPDAIIHEYIHTVFPVSRDLYSEALAEYFGKILCGNTYWQEEFYKYYLFETKEVDEPITQSIQTYYYNHHKKPQGADEIDPSISIDAIAYSSLINDYHVGGVWKSLESRYGNRMKKEGMELNYPEATSFINYLFNQYSMDTVVNAALSNTSYKDAYGKEYEILKKEWIEYLNE